jgi:hypothetical protein
MSDASRRKSADGLQAQCDRLVPRSCRDGIAVVSIITGVDKSSADQSGHEQGHSTYQLLYGTATSRQLLISFTSGAIKWFTQSPDNLILAGLHEYADFLWDNG